MAFPLLVFTDLDGSLLDHHSYSFKGAEKALIRLQQLAVPLILTSSKTRAEIEILQIRLGLHEAFITENGGGIFLPLDHPLQNINKLQQFNGYRGKQFGKPYKEIRRIFQTIKDRYKLIGFGDMTVDEISKLTGLTRKQACLAQKRDFSEPFLFLVETDLQALKTELVEYGLTVTRGGRFYHLISTGQDKGRAVIGTKDLFQAEYQDRIITIGVGDAENDYPMLRIVDIPVLIPKPDGSYVNMHLDGLRKAPHPGSKGWGESIMATLEELEKQRTTGKLTFI
ncbi:MAG: HAD-IIB family hydrolase [Deltaproteobacteria bacterium]|jgi:mannosyl-3-phosphoglycerate phosphatase|nr:HAD-IIB family hydrolase [Deltaproteobacteria bacterium]